MPWHREIAQRLAALVVHPDFRMKTSESYSNKFGRRGQRLVGEMKDTLIFFSESDTVTPSNVEYLSKVFAAPNWLDESKVVIYESHRRLGIGIRLEARFDGRWFQVFIPVDTNKTLDPFIANILELATRSD